MALNFQDIDRRNAEAARAQRPAILSGSYKGEPEELSLLQQAGDVLASPFRGVEGAAQDLYGLADMLAFDALPDYQERVFGTSRTAVGGLLEGLVNFGVGFVGSGYLLPERLFASAGRLAPIARAVARGAATDFSVFSAHEGRLADLIQQFPALQNPVTEYLASDPKDSEAEGRFKNVLEGLGIGAFTELVGLGFKALKIGRDARARKLSPAAVEDAIDKGVPHAEIQAAMKQAMQQDPGKGIPGVIGDPARPEAAQAARTVPSLLTRNTAALQQADRIWSEHAGSMGFADLETDARGVVVGIPTRFDRLAVSNPTELARIYQAFEPMRAALRDQFGDTIELWRAQGSGREGRVAGAKAFLSYASKEQAEKFLSPGRALISRHVPVSDIVAAQRSHGGGYEEYIVREAAAPISAAPTVVPEPPRTTAGTEEHGAAILRTMGVSDEQAKELFLAVRRREAPISVDLQGLPPLDPRTNPRRLSPEERLAEGLNLTDLNLSRYRGPEGALQLIRAMPQVFEALGTKGEVTRRTLKEQEVTGLQALADIVGAGPGQRHRLLVMLQADENTIVGVNRRALGYRVALQAAGDDAYRAMQKALAPNGGDKDLLEFVEALSFHHDVQSSVMGLVGEQGRGLGANRIPTKHVADLFSREEIEAALHQRGGKGRALDLAKKFKVLYNSTADPAKRAAKVGDMARGLAGRRAFSILNEYWYNSLLGRPTTLVAAALSNTLTTIYRPLENLIGGALTGQSDIMLDSVREVVGLVHSARESWAATVAAIRGGGQLLDPSALVSDIRDASRKAITPESLGIDPNSIHGVATSWVGRLIRYPSEALNANDQFFKQLNYRAIGRSQLTRDVLKANPGMAREQVAALVEEQLGKLIYKGQAFGNAQLYHRGVDDAVRSGLTDKLAVDEHARSFMTRYLSDPARAAEHERLSAIGDIALNRAHEVAQTTPLTPGTLPYRYQEAVLNHPVLRLITPFVRTPTNILGFAFDRNVNVITGIAQLLADRIFPKALAPVLENSKNRLVMDILSRDPRRKAEAAGRLSLGLATSAAIIMLAGETDDEGRPLITGFGPRDVETRRALEQSGWQQYSIRVGDGYASYGRLDPFATILGVATDVVNYVRYAAPEDQETAENLSYGLGIAIASNLTNKTYLAGLANMLDMLGDPQKEFPRWINTLAASFVPGQAAAAVTVDDPLLRDVRSMLDAARARWPGASDDLPPLRNVLGEPVLRAQSLGAGMNPITNAFVPILYREVSDDLINTEFARLRHGFTPPKRTRGGLDLTTVVGASGQNAFDRWLELHGEVKIGGKNLRAALRRLITSPNYTRIPADSTDELASPRIQLIQGVIEDYRARAYRQLVTEYPELGQADRAKFQRRAALRRGVETRPELADALRPNPGAVNQATQRIVNTLTGR